MASKSVGDAANALAQLVKAINDSGGPTLDDVNKMQDLAYELNGVNLGDEIGKLLTEVNELSTQIGNLKADCTRQRARRPS